MDSPAITIGLPVALGIVMLGLGLSLTIGDFRRVARYPRAAIVALLCQIVVLPVLCFGLVLAFGLPADFAVGLLLLAATPGGSMANLYSHLFGGHVALNVTLTAINSVLAVVTLPVVVNLSAAYFLDGGASIGLQFDKVLQVFAIVLIPVAVGMLVRARVPLLSQRLDRPVRILSVVVVITVITGAVLSERDHLAEYFLAVGLAALAFNVLSLAIGYAVPRLLGIERRSATAIGFEVGLHNTTIAITVAVSPVLLNNVRIAIPAAVYGIISVFSAMAFGYLVNRRQPAPAVSGEPA